MQLAESQAAPLPAASLTGLIERARTTLAGARGAAEILEARDKAIFAYDAAKCAARIGRARQAHDEVITATYRVQADALEIEADAKRRLADEYDAAQESGEVARVGDNQHSQGVSGANDLGISRKTIFEGRQIAEAEQIAPGLRQTLDSVIEAGRNRARQPCAVPSKASSTAIVRSWHRAWRRPMTKISTLLRRGPHAR